MKVRDAIAQADKLRPNKISDERKARWLFELDADFAETMETVPLEFTFPCEDTELLMPYPHDDVYALYLQAMIDFAQQDMELYENDMAMANAAADAAKAWWRRHHPHTPSRPFRTM